MSTPETLPPTPNPSQQPTEADPVAFPPWVLLAIAGLALLAMLFFLFTRNQATVEVFGAGGVALISLFAWAVMNPDQLRDVLRGRAVSYGGTAVLVTVLFFIALVFVYIVIREQNWRRDFSDQQIFSLTEQAREIVQTIAADPTMPTLKIIGFYGLGQASSRDRAAVLMDDIVKYSNNKITYEFIDPDQNPLLLQTYAATAGQFIVGPVGADGQIDKDSAQVFSGLNQQTIVDSLITASSTGSFNAFFLRVRDGIDFTTPESGGGQLISEDLSSRYKWNAQVVSMLDLMGTKPSVTLNDPAANGDVMVIAGGAEPLTAEQVKVITDYLDKGGSLVLMAGLNLENGTPLAAADPLASYLYTNFGIKVNNDLIIDLDNGMGNAFSFQALPANVDHFIVRDFKDTGFLLFGGAHSIDLNPQTPADVTVTVLASTSPSAYSKSGLDLTRELTEADIARLDTDKSGALPIVAASENSTTHARVVVFGSVDSIVNDARQLVAANIRNSDMARNAILWAAGYDSFRNIPSLEIVTPQPVPLFATEQQVQMVQFVAVLLMPILILMVGAWRWWARRERERLS